MFKLCIHWYEKVNQYIEWYFEREQTLAYLGGLINKNAEAILVHILSEWVIVVYQMSNILSEWAIVVYQMSNILSEWAIVVYQMSNFPSTSWQEQVTFRWDDEDVCFVLDQYA